MTIFHYFSNEIVSADENSQTLTNCLTMMSKKSVLEVRLSSIIIYLFIFFIIRPLERKKDPIKETI